MAFLKNILLLTFFNFTDEYNCIHLKWFDLHLYRRMINKIKIINTSIILQLALCVCVCVLRTLKICSQPLSSLQYQITNWGPHAVHGVLLGPCCCTFNRDEFVLVSNSILWYLYPVTCSVVGCSQVLAITDHQLHIQVYSSPRNWWSRLTWRGARFLPHPHIYKQLFINSPIISKQLTQ